MAIMDVDQQLARALAEIDAAVKMAMGNIERAREQARLELEQLGRALADKVTVFAGASSAGS